LSSATRPLIALTTTWPQVLIIRALDRTGKGIRGAPRDVMLARFATPEISGRIFGFHRAMDHTGAILGPLIATAILYFAPGEYRLLFALTVIPGAIAVALLFLVPDPDSASPGPLRGTRPTERAAETPVGRVPRSGPAEPPIGRGPRMGPAEVPRRASAERLPRRLWAFLAILIVFSLGNSADAFLLLRLSEVLGGAAYIPLLWAGLHVVKASLSTWGGALSDRLGRRRVIIAGWTIYAVVYLGFATARDAWTLIAWFLAYGSYFALTEGAEKALVADLTPEGRQGTAFGIYNAALGVGALAASVTFGFLYERFGAEVAFTTGSALAATAAVLLACIPATPDRGAIIVGSDAKNSRHQ
jgi:MFS family permease